MSTVILPSRNIANVSVFLQEPVVAPVSFERALLLTAEAPIVTYLSGIGQRGLEIDSLQTYNSFLSSNSIDSSPSTTGCVTTYFAQEPTPPPLYLAYVDRSLFMNPDPKENDPREYFWDIINSLLNVDNFYHVFFAGDQSDFVSDTEATALARYFQGGSSYTFTPPSGMTNDIVIGGSGVAFPTRPVLCHLMAGNRENIGSSAATANNISAQLSQDPTNYTRIQLYYPDSPNGMINTSPVTNITYYPNKLSSAVVATLCSGSRFNRFPGTLSTANLTNLQGLTVITNGQSNYPPVNSTTPHGYPVDYNTPDLSQINSMVGPSNNLLIYIQSPSPNIRLTYKTGSTPVNYSGGIPFRYIDQTIAIDWMETTIIQRVFALINSVGPPKYTTEGFNSIRTIIQEIIDEGKRQGVLNSSYGPAQGEYIIVPDAEDATPEQRQMRVMPPVTFRTQLSESINQVTIIGSVQP